MDRFDKVVEDFSIAVQRFKESVERAHEREGSSEYSFYRDSAIQRFEFTFEVMWKVIKIFLEKEGIICRSPRGCIREFFSAGYISEEEAREMLNMVDDRNLTVHAYNEEIAEDIFSRLTEYLKVFESLLNRFKKLK